MDHMIPDPAFSVLAAPPQIAYQRSQHAPYTKYIAQPNFKYPERVTGFFKVASSGKLPPRHTVPETGVSVLCL